MKRQPVFSARSTEVLAKEIVNEDDPDKRHTMIYGDFFTKTLLSVGFFRDSIAQCFECMRVCPVGRKHRKLR